MVGGDAPKPMEGAGGAPARRGVRARGWGERRRRWRRQRRRRAAWEVGRWLPVDAFWTGRRRTAAPTRDFVNGGGALTGCRLPALACTRLPSCDAEGGRRRVHLVPSAPLSAGSRGFLRPRLRLRLRLSRRRRHRRRRRDRRRLGRV
ncbi:Protein of unknown function [Gryllus bimaculatus]|nr:Protein of unknown function [Gryllus bimaculatus]